MSKFIHYEWASRRYLSIHTTALQQSWYQYSPKYTYSISIRISLRFDPSCMRSYSIHYHTTNKGNEMTTVPTTSIVAHYEEIYLEKSPRSCLSIHRLTMIRTQLFLICMVMLINASTASIQEEGLACTAMAIAMPELQTLKGEKTRLRVVRRSY